MKRNTRRPLFVLAIAAALLAVWTLPVGAKNGGSQGHSMTVSGDSVFDESCPDPGGSAGAIRLSGAAVGEGLEGCLSFFPTTYQCDELNGFALYREQGTELFIGSHDGDTGEFKTRYSLEATYQAGSCTAIDANWAGENVDFPFADQLTGGCDHFIKGTSGVFKGARGLITFHDVIEPGSGATNYFYSGWLRLSGSNR